MSLFAALASAVQNQPESSGSGNLLGFVMNTLNSPEIGGLPGLMQKFSDSGLGEQFASWVGNGQNLPVTAEQIQTALGSNALQEIESRFGIDHATASSALAGLLPHMVDQLTPNGHLPENGTDAMQLMSAFSSLFAGKRA